MKDGYNCETCGKYHEYPMYVYAHSREVLIATCDNCGAKHEIIMFNAKQIESGDAEKRKRND